MYICLHVSYTCIYIHCMYIHLIRVYTCILIPACTHTGNNSVVKIREGSLAQWDETRVSRSFPGLETLYKLYQVRDTHTHTCVNIWHYSCICDMTDSHVTWVIRAWHDSVICDTTHSYVIWLMHIWHDSFIWDVTHSCWTGGCGGRGYIYIYIYI